MEEKVKIGLSFRLAQIETLSKQQILDTFKIKKFADDNFKSNENGKKVLQSFRKHWEKEKLLVMSNFFLFPRCFLKTCTADDNFYI